MILAVLIAVSFVNGYQLFIDHVLYGILILSLFIPIFYSEFILGFVLGMTLTFGAILPTIFILAMAVPGLVIYRFIRPFIIRLAGLIPG
ncbi:MAG: hypothetical protein EA409_13650 [Saprospirales bacterium]|nr:MAG: hypothetical protein EA409_13650 [Saprospirales bacterium]